MLTTIGQHWFVGRDFTKADQQMWVFHGGQFYRVVEAIQFKVRAFPVNPEAEQTELIVGLDEAPLFDQTRYAERFKVIDLESLSFERLKQGWLYPDAVLMEAFLTWQRGGDALYGFSQMGVSIHSDRGAHLHNPIRAIRKSAERIIAERIKQLKSRFSGKLRC